MKISLPKIRAILNVIFFWCIAMLGIMAMVMPMRSMAIDVGNGAVLLKALNAQKLDETVNVLNQIKHTQHRGDVLPLLQDLWGMNQKKYPDLPWSFVNLDVVRVNIADILVQAYRNGQTDVDRASIHAFTKKVAASTGDIQARGTALLVLGIIGDARDIHLLRAAVLEERELISTSALVSLGMMCNEDAGKTLGTLTKMLKGKQFVDRAKDAQRLYADAVKSRSGWCNQRPFI